MAKPTIWSNYTLRSWFCRNSRLSFSLCCWSFLNIGVSRRTIDLSQSRHSDLSDTGVTNNINHGCISFIGVSGPRPLKCEYWLTGMVNWNLKWNTAIVNVIIYTCAFHAVTSQNVLCENGLYLICLWLQHNSKA